MNALKTIATGIVESLIGLVILPVVGVVVIAGVVVSSKSREDGHWTNRLAGGFMRSLNVSFRKVTLSN